MLNSSLEQCLSRGGMAQFVATSDAQIRNLGTGETEVPSFVRVGAGSKPVACEESSFLDLLILERPEQSNS